MHIHGLNHAQSTHSVSSPHAARKPGGPTGAETNRSIADQLDLSPEAQALSAGQEIAPSEGIRTEKVAAIRQAIADGTYETPEKLSAALDRLLDTFA